MGTLNRVALAAWAAALAIGPATAHATAITEFPLTAHPMSDPVGITGGADGDVWFSDGGLTHAIGRITPGGTITEFTKGLTQTNGYPSDMTLGPDGNVWFTEIGAMGHNAIGRITPSGVIREFTNGLMSTSAPSEITSGPDGKLWFLDASAGAIGRITPSGTINEFTGLNANAAPEALTVGADGNLWFTDRGNTPAIGRVSPSGTIMEFNAGVLPNGIAAGPDGNIWFTDDGAGAIFRTAPSGTVNEFQNGLSTGTVPDAITAGPDGNLWFNNQIASDRTEDRITPAGKIDEFRTNLSQSRVQNDITTGADGNLWIEQSTPDGVLPGAVARITPAGTITEFTQGMKPGSGGDGDHIITGPDGNLWFSDRGSRAIGRVALQLPPSAMTGSASDVTWSGARVTGAVNPLGAATTVSFDYGRTPALGSIARAGRLVAAGTATSVAVRLTHLAPGTVIYYRVVARNGFGTIKGKLQHLKTAAAQRTVVTIGNQRITLTTPSPRACTNVLDVSLTAIRIGAGPRLRFKRASFYLRARGPAIAVAHRLPFTLSIQPLTPGRHTLTVVIVYGQVTKTLTSGFKAC